jgi:cytoskeletal protein RodZ
MNRNQKIALGCGGAGCLGLIVVAIAGVLIWFFATSRSTNRNFNLNTNTNRSTNRNSATNENSETPGSSSSMSEDDKHKLFQAAGFTQDTELIARVMKKLGFMRANGTTTPEYEKFTKEHFAWALRNTDFIQSISTPEKARAYVDEHIND